MKKYLFLLYFSATLFAQHEWHGDHYQKTSRPQYEMAKFAVSILPQRTYQSILDIGCGSGDFTIELTNIAECVHGVDYSESMINKAHELYGTNKKVTFAVDDIRTLATVTQNYDLITAFHPIQWIPAKDQSKAFKQMAHHLNPGGICLVLVSARENIFYEPLMHTVKKNKWKKDIPQNIEPWNWQTIESIHNSFVQVGLKPLHIFVWNKKYSFESKQHFFDFMKNWFCNASHFNYITEKRKNELFNEILEYFLASMSYSGNGSVEFESPFIIGIAEK